MNLKEIEQNVESLDLDQGFDLIYQLLRAYGVPRASVSRLKGGAYDRSDRDDEHLWKGKLYYRQVLPGVDLHSAIDEAAHEGRIVSQNPRFLIVRNQTHLVASDTLTGSTLDIALAELGTHFDFFLPWAGLEKAQLESINHADLRAAEKMAKIYDEIVGDERNRPGTEGDVRRLNIFFSRLLFCFFAEDTGVFPGGSFTTTLASVTREDGSDTKLFLDDLFDVLNTPLDERVRVPGYATKFGYVNGKLFAESASAPEFTNRARRMTIECGTLDWSLINPDIFGSMIQAVVHPTEREGLGMHYTSVETIRKVIRPLFLDELNDAVDSANTVGLLEGLLRRVSELQVFDPACGSGNFLVISYKELRRLEHRILQRLEVLQPTKIGLFSFSRIRLTSFHGIEIDDFAREIATVSLWLAKHQMNIEFAQLFNVEIPLIPLREAGNIVCENAVTLDWLQLVPGESGDDVFIVGNPPYKGAKFQEPQHKADFKSYFGTANYPGNLDYISLWFFKGAEFIERRPGARLGFVATNSICQGEHVGLMWPRIYDHGLDISFAHTSFPWKNEAKHNALVTPVVVGLAVNPPVPRRLYTDGLVRLVPNINPYLAVSTLNTIVLPLRASVGGLPVMKQGSRASDFGLLTLSEHERTSLVSECPEALPLIRSYMGADEFLGGTERYCLWIEDATAEAARGVPEIARRLDSLQKKRAAAGISAQAVANTPHRFGHRVHIDGPSIIVPRQSNQRREYHPVGFLDGGTVISDAAYAIYGAEPWVAAIIQSRLHMVWVKAVGGKFREDPRYSNTLCYNTFPVPELNDRRISELNEHALVVLEIRERYSDRTIDSLYDPEKMPNDLLRAHERADGVFERMYRERTFDSDEERLAMLFDIYEAETSVGSGVDDA